MFVNLVFLFLIFSAKCDVVFSYSSATVHKNEIEFEEFDCDYDFLKVTSKNISAGFNKKIEAKNSKIKFFDEVYNWQIELSYLFFYEKELCGKGFEMNSNVGSFLKIKKIFFKSNYVNLEKIEIRPNKSKFSWKIKSEKIIYEDEEIRFFENYITVAEKIEIPLLDISLKTKPGDGFLMFKVEKDVEGLTNFNLPYYIFNQTNDVCISFLIGRNLGLNVMFRNFNSLSAMEVEIRKMSNDFQYFIFFKKKTPDFAYDFRIFKDSEYGKVVNIERNCGNFSYFFIKKEPINFGIFDFFKKDKHVLNFNVLFYKKISGINFFYNFDLYLQEFLQKNKMNRNFKFKDFVYFGGISMDQSYNYDYFRHKIKINFYNIFFEDWVENFCYSLKFLKFKAFDKVFTPIFECKTSEFLNGNKRKIYFYDESLCLEKNYYKFGCHVVIFDYLSIESGFLNKNFYSIFSYNFKNIYINYEILFNEDLKIFLSADTNNVEIFSKINVKQRSLKLGSIIKLTDFSMQFTLKFKQKIEYLKTELSYEFNGWKINAKYFYWFYNQKYRNGISFSISLSGLNSFIAAHEKLSTLKKPELYFKEYL